MLTDYPNIRCVGPDQRWDEGRIVVTRDFSFITQAHTQYIYLYKNHGSSDSFLPDYVLKDSLSTLLETYYPPLAGWFEVGKDSTSVVWSKNEKNPPVFTTNVSDMDYPEMVQMTKVFDPELIPVPPTGKMTENNGRTPLILVKVTRTRANSALALGVSYNHVLMDGLALCSFMNNWAYVCKQMMSGTARESAVALRPPYFGSMDLDRDAGPDNTKAEHNEYIRVSTKINAWDSLEGKRKTTEHRLVIPPQKKQRMREEAHRIGVSLNSYVCALVWKEVNILRLQTRPEIASEPTVLSMAVGVRKRLGVVEDHCSSAVFATREDKYTVTQIVSGKIDDFARIVSSSVREATGEYIVSAFRAIKALESDIKRDAEAGNDRDRIVASFTIPGASDFSVGSNINFPAYRTDFGAGVPEYVRPPLIPFDGMLRLWPGPPNNESDNSLELFLSLYDDIVITRSAVLNEFISN